MAKNLVIVESPAKARTLARFLGRGYAIKASLGHVRDLPPKSLGVDVANDFSPRYVVLPARKKLVKEIKEVAQDARAVYLATDPDREGEAISWHLIEAAKLSQVPTKRVIFHEITEEAISQAFRHPRRIDMKLVEAQQARRILDRLVGYRISPLLWRRVRPGLSAGRVQSAALRMVVDRENEVRAFVPAEYWTIEAELAKDKGSSFRAKLVGVLGGGQVELKEREQAEAVVATLKEASYSVAAVQQKKVSRQPSPPFITSTLQQEAWRRLGFAAKRTMTVAQQLYEGLSLGAKGPVGLITYMRTDSTRVAAQAVAEARAYISEKLGADFVPPSPRRFAKAKGAQEAHEAIRPTSVRRQPEDVKGYLSADQFKLYRLIWQRMVASQMAAARFDTTTVEVAARTKKKDGYLLRATSSVISFPGFLAIYRLEEEEAEGRGALPTLKKGDGLSLLGLFPEQHFTQPPPRYTDATLVKALEENGIGRPSTYAPILSLLQERTYVEKKKGRFEPTELGFLVDGLLREHFSPVIDPGFTAQMEEELDDIARGQRQWVPMLHEFYGPFSAMVDKAKTAIPKVEEPTEETCELCGRPMVIKWGRRGKFMSCSGFPECKHARPLETATVAEPTDEVCQLCGRPMVIKWGRWGRFMSCSGYPECRNTKPVVTTIGVRCPRCGGELVEKRSRKGRTFYGCGSYPQCDFAIRDRPLPQPCPRCRGLLTKVAQREQAKCRGCGHILPLSELEGGNEDTGD